ncbi:MAG: SIR2 family NAD-dependent protein deacylase [Gammaproteobacteria bacterium]
MQIPEGVLNALRRSQHLVVLSGAGISAESGVPTFRDAQTGLWSRYRPEDLATPEAFERDPELVWQWYESRRQKLAEVEPNPGHFALAQLQEILPRLTVITQNVDGLHQRAGSREVIEFHGSITRSICSARPCSGGPATDDSREPPRCTQCGAHIRPDVVWFGEAIPAAAIAAATEAMDSADRLLSVGTSSVVYPAAGLIDQALRANIGTLEINPAVTPFSDVVDFSLRGKAGEMLPELVQLLDITLK